MSSAKSSFHSSSLSTPMDQHQQRRLSCSRASNQQLPPATPPPPPARRKSQQPMAATSQQQYSPRMRRFAERLAVIQISLDPPSPPEFALQSPDERDGKSPVPFWAAQPGYEHWFRRPIEDSLLLQVPRVLDSDDAGPLRQCSPPPRRCSYASTLSENSSISLNTSYQSLLFSPLVMPSALCANELGQHNSARSRSSTCCSEGEDTPPTNEAAFVYAQQLEQNRLMTMRESDGAEAGQGRRSKRSHSQCMCGQQQQQRPRRSHSTVSTPCDPGCPSPAVLLSPVLLSRPIRSQSAHSPNLLRNAQPPSDSESELLAAVCCSRPSPSRQSQSRLSISRPSNSSSPLATPPPLLCGSPLPLLGFPGSRNVSRSGSFSRHLLQHQNSLSSGSQRAVVSVARCHSFSRGGQQHQALVRQRTGTFSHNDSFESGDSFPPHPFPPAGKVAWRSPAQQHHPLLAGRPPSAAAQLQRSQSDALDPVLSRHSPAGTRATQGAVGFSGERLICFGDRGTATNPRRPSSSLRDLQNHDFLHSSLDSCGSYPEHPAYPYLNQPFIGSTTTSQIGHHAKSYAGQKQSTNLMRLRLYPLGHSDPQIYTYTPPASSSLCAGRGAGGHQSSAAINSTYNFNVGRRSFISTSPQTCRIRKEALANPPNFAGPKYMSQHRHGGSPSQGTGGQTIEGNGARRSPVQIRMHHRSSFSSVGSGHHPMLGQGGLGQPGAHYGYPQSTSARPSVSSGCHSSNRQPVTLRALPPNHHLENRRWSLASLPSSSGYGTPGTNSAHSSQYSSQENIAGLVGDLRIRDRFDSNESYACCLGDEFGGQMRPRSRSLTSPVHLFDRLALDTPQMSSMYKERFPKAKHQMENKLLQFLVQNAPLSGYTSQLLQPANGPGALPQQSASQLAPLPQSRDQQRPTSPRPQSPVPIRPLSPLVTESATAVGDAVIRSSAHFLGSELQQPVSQQGSSSSFFGQQHQEAADGGCQSPSLLNRSSLSSPIGSSMLTATEPSLLRLISDGATRFLHHQVCEIAADCLQKSRDDLLSCAYFYNMSVRLDETLAEAEIKVGLDSYKYLARLVKQILMIVSRAARLLECLEFNPDDFYQLLSDSEQAVRMQLGSGSAKVPDLPQYILTKLGLNKNLSIAQTMEDMDVEGSEKGQREQEVKHYEGGAKEHLFEAPVGEHSFVRDVPKEEDFETIRLISNGAYGAVYLVRHKRTRHRFALKKMKKQTLLLRNQIEQVYAERDILTFTDNPFVVCFYGSFETKQHLCMLMEYLEGGDCASLLKSAGTLPIELARLYVAETVLAIEYLHSCGIVHRDLKPDNLLITSMGHIKLTDFGLSKIGLMNRTTLVSEGYMQQDDTHQFKDNQLCGTPEYIAPEVILRQGYGKPVDWWALGIILYEFLVGIVPFMGDSPEALFANIINEEVEYPEEDEALEESAKLLIQMLLEKNPVDRLGTVGGAKEVSSHPFFDSIDFDTVLRQKAEFVPQLENEEDTSYFDSRTDRYNHDAESAEEDDSVPMFWSFSTASPRHSILGLELPTGGLAMLQVAHAAAIERGQELDDDRESGGRVCSSSGVESGLSLAFGPCPPSNIPISSDVHEPQGFENQHQLKANKLGDLLPGEVIPSAVILRRRFSNQRHTNTNVSTSSSGTTGTAAGPNTCSSTDSSLDASHSHINFDSRRSHGQLPRLAISPCASASMVDQESARQHIGAAGKRGGIAVGESDGGKRMEKRPSVVVHELITDTNKVLTTNQLVQQQQMISRQARSSSCRNAEVSLRVHIPASSQQQHLSASSSTTASPSSTNQQGHSQATTYYHSYTANNTLGIGIGAPGSSSGQFSPSCNSVSSASSFDSQNNSNPLHQHQQLRPAMGGGPFGPVSVDVMQLTNRQPPSVCSPSPSSLLPPPSSGQLLPPHHRSSISGGASRPPIIIRKGQQGFGFSIRSVRVYLSEISEYYSIEHIVSDVRQSSPAWEAGLRPNDLVTHVHTQSVHNMTHPQLMHRLLSCGNELTLHVVPLSNTSIKEGEPRRNIGKPLRKKPKKPQPKGKQTGRKSSTLLRRLSGKRGNVEIVPGSSSQKQTFMPRSVSSQEGVLATSGPPAGQQQPQPSRSLRS